MRLLVVRCLEHEHFNNLIEKLDVDIDGDPKLIKRIYITNTESKFVLDKIVTSQRQGDVNKPKKYQYRNDQWTNIYDFVTDKMDDIKIHFYFENTSVEQLAELFEQQITAKTKTITFPRKDVDVRRFDRYISDRNKPRYPIYVVSKGRAEQCLTAEHLVKMNVDFFIVVESQEYDEYAKYFDKKHLLILDMDYVKNYPSYDEYGMTKPKGPGPARNFVWDHSISLGAKWHWVLDDNVKGFFKFTNNYRTKIADGSAFTVVEDFIDRYHNIGIAGFDYHNFVLPGFQMYPYVEHSKIYSLLFIRNDIKFRWAGRYNEDTDICLRVLKEGYSTILMKTVVGDKMATQTMSGGNTEIFYNSEGTLPKSKMLYIIHPDLTEIKWKFSRWHHEVYYPHFYQFLNRDIKDILTVLSAPSILTLDDKEIIREIMKLDFTKEIFYNTLFPNLEDKLKKTKIIEAIKLYTYLIDNKQILRKLLAVPVLELYDFMFLDESIEDERIAKILIDLYPNKVDKLYDLTEVLHFVSDEKKIQKIQTEIMRNKYFLKDDFPKYEYNFRKFSLTEEEHMMKHDSLKYIQKTYMGMDIPEEEIPITQTDKVIRNIIKRKQKKVDRHIILRGENSLSDTGNMICITGDEEFSDKNFCFKELDRIISENDLKFDGIINGAKNTVDKYIADYALINNIKCYEFVPDFYMNSDDAIKSNIEEMCKQSKQAIIFLTKEDSIFSTIKDKIEDCYIVTTHKQIFDIENIFN